MKITRTVIIAITAVLFISSSLKSMEKQFSMKQPIRYVTREGKYVNRESLIPILEPLYRNDEPFLYKGRSVYYFTVDDSPIWIEDQTQSKYPFLRGYDENYEEVYLLYKDEQFIVITLD